MAKSSRSTSVSSRLKLEQQLRRVGNELSYFPTQVDQLLRLLDKAQNLLVEVGQSPSESMKNAYSQCMKALVAEPLFRHPDADVQAAVASCISTLTLTTAPEAPYAENQMKEVFQLIVSSFKNLSDMSSRSYKHRVYILKTVDKVKLTYIMLDLECNGLLSEMFQHFLSSIRDFHPEKIFRLMETTMTTVLEERDVVSPELLVPILASLNKNHGEVSSSAWKLGVSVLAKCAVKVQPYLKQAVEIRGLALDAYSEIVAAICNESDGEVRHNNGSVSQQKGLENAMKDILPQAEHMLCTRHIYSNLRKKYPSTMLKRWFWAAACSTHPVAHKNAMKQILNLSKPAHEQLGKLDPAVWSKAYISTTPKADSIENNMSECFNSWIINERYLPVLTMLQEIHYKLMTRVRDKREAMLSSNMQLCPRIKKILDLAVMHSRDWRASWDGDSRYMVKSGTKAVTVDLEKSSCSCRVFDIRGIPCAHAVAAIHDRRQQPIDFVCDYYKREKYLKAYSFSIEAIAGEEYWEEYSTEQLLPPEIPKKLRGRPKRLRRREGWERGSGNKGKQIEGDVPQLQRFSSGRVQHCSICRKRGHKKNKCPGLTITNEGGEADGDGGQGGETDGGAGGAGGEAGGASGGTAAASGETGGAGVENVVQGVETGGASGGTAAAGGGIGGAGGGTRRPKLFMRRAKTKGPQTSVIPTQQSQTTSSVTANEPTSSDTSHFMKKVLGSMGCDALYKPTGAHSWVWNRPPYKKVLSTSTAPSTTNTPSTTVSAPPRRTSSRLRSVMRNKAQKGEKSTADNPVNLD